LQATFDKSSSLFPVKDRCVYLAHCGISPLYSGAFQREAEMARVQMEEGGAVFRRYPEVMDELKSVAARMMRTSPDNAAFVKNTSEAMGMIANGYPFEPGDEIVGYVHEYPANHYPWKLQERRGAVLKLLPDRDRGGPACRGKPCGWSLEDLEGMVSERTRLVAVSHVQFTSGFAADLKALGSFCAARGIDLVVDAAQSLGCLPVYPDEWGISAVAASGWKWLLGPVGVGLFYTSPAFRDKLEHVMTGAELMVQGEDYLDHRWAPHGTAKRFEYSTSPMVLAAALTECLKGGALRYGLEALRDEVFRLQDVLLEGLDRDRFAPVEFPEAHRSGILSVACAEDPLSVVKEAASRGVTVSSRGGYLRLAPHFYNDDEEMHRAADVLNGKK